MQKLLVLALGLCLLAAPLASADHVDPAVAEVLMDGLEDEFNAMVQDIASADGAEPWMGVATLTGANVVPMGDAPPVETNTTGYFMIAVGQTQAAWWLAVRAAKKQLMSHLHFGNTTTNGPAVRLLAPSGPPSDLIAGIRPVYSPSLSGAFLAMDSFNASGIVLPNSATPSIPDFQAAIEAGNVYVDVHSEIWRGGVVRGHITAVESIGR